MHPARRAFNTLLGSAAAAALIGSGAAWAEDRSVTVGITMPLTGSEAVRDAIQAAHVKTLQGEISFDANGDLQSRVVSVFQVRYDPKYPVNDVIHQFKYVGVAPAEAS
jgi:ABC-type branched-subunit amino acid transport system substrate-binding protein